MATDVAARGLDIPDIDHVIHFQVPMTADVFISTIHFPPNDLVSFMCTEVGVQHAPTKKV